MSRWSSKRQAPFTVWPTSSSASCCFIDESNTILWQENHKTSIERYMNYSAAQGIPARDLTSWDA